MSVNSERLKDGVGAVQVHSAALLPPACLTGSMACQLPLAADAHIHRRSPWRRCLPTPDSQHSPPLPPGVLILHPYSLLGGSMSDHVVCELFRACAASPRCSVVLKYNQRGVGRSSGSRNVRGRDDAADVMDLIDFVCAQMPTGSARRVVVVGYSWCAVPAGALQHP